MKRLRLASLLPLLLLGGVLTLTTSTAPAADDGPVVQMIVAPTR